MKIHIHSGNWPWVTVAVSALALALSLTALFDDRLLLLCFDRNAIVNQGQWWRLLTGHLVHSSGSHLGWDLLAFALFAGLAESYNRTAMLVSIGLALLLLNALLLSPLGLEQYSGLSGILCAPAVLALYAHFRRQPDLLHLLPALVAVAKLLLEASSQDPLLSQPDWPLYQPAHWVGVVAGGITLAGLILTGMKAKPRTTFVTPLGIHPSSGLVILATLLVSRWRACFDPVSSVYRPASGASEADRRRQPE